MFTLFSMKVTMINSGSLPESGSKWVLLDNRKRISRNTLYRMRDGGWAGYALGSNGEVVLYFKQDQQAGGKGFLLNVTESGTYHFGRKLVGFKGSVIGSTPRQFDEHEAFWGWFPDEESDPLEIPDRSKLPQSVPA